jgi:hypothetical protein
MPLDEPKYFKENHTKEKGTEILRKVKRSKIQVIISMLCSIYEQFCSIYHHISTALVTQ